MIRSIIFFATALIFITCRGTRGRRILGNKCHPQIMHDSASKNGVPDIISCHLISRTNRNDYDPLNQSYLAVVRDGPEQTTAHSGRYRRLAGGQPTLRDHYPYLVSLGDRDGIHFCGGTLLTETAILTAAHCVEKWPKGKICVSASEPYQFSDNFKCNPVNGVHKHNHYVSHGGVDDAENDIAIVTVNTSFVLSDKIKLVNLTEMKNSDAAIGQIATVIGWGAVTDPNKQDEVQNPEHHEWDYCRLDSGVVVGARVFPKTLQEANMTIISRDDCQKLYNDTVYEGILCAYLPRTGQCFKDSGGPLIHEGHQLGVFVSFKHCGSDPGYPCLYVDITKYRKWIYATLKAISKPPGSDPKVTDKPPHFYYQYPKKYPNQSRRILLQEDCDHAMADEQHFNMIDF